VAVVLGTLVLTGGASTDRALASAKPSHSRAGLENVFQKDRHARNAGGWAIHQTALDRHVTSRTYHQHALRHPAAPSLVHERTGRTAYFETRSKHTVRPPRRKRSPVYPASRAVIAAAHYLGARAGIKTFAVIDNRRKLSGTGLHVRFHSASVVKAMLLVADLKTLAAEHRDLDESSRALLYPMIHSSDNNAATGVFSIVGDSGLERVAREARMVDFATDGGWWGFTEISAADMARFFLRQDSLIPRQFDGYARWLLSTIEPSESWGIPAAARGGGLPFQVFFKGGWLPMSEGLVNQAARLERPHKTFAMAVLTRDDPSMAYGEETIAGVATRLLRDGLPR
jgi:hypothetical protein